MNQDSLWNIVKELKTVWGKQTEDVSKLFHQPLVQKSRSERPLYVSSIHII